MKKFVALFTVKGAWEHLRLFADTKDQAEDIAISIYKDFVKDGFIPCFDFVAVYEVK